MDVGLHPDVASLAGLIGTWTGTGQGTYPTIEPFRYSESVEFGHVGKPFVAYRQSTVNLGSGLPAHAEAGYLRGVGGGRIELVLAQPSGIVEVAEGTVEPLPGGFRVNLRTTSVTGTPTAKDVHSVERTIEVSGDTLRYDLAMSAVGQPLQHHLAAELHRT
jgi:hypothetical protein